MPQEQNVYNRKITITDSDFNVDDVCKAVKEKGESLGYIFIEKEQTSKGGKYGHKLDFKFLFTRNVDPFVNYTFNVDFVFDNLSQTKNGHHGDGEVKIKGFVKFDHPNKYGKTKLNKFFFELYMKLFKQLNLEKYIIPLVGEGGQIYDVIKTKFDLY